MKRVRGDVLWLAAGVVIVLAFTLAHPEQGSPPSTYSSYDTGPNGYRAIYEVMRREGVTTGRLGSALGTLHRFAGTIVISTIDTGQLSFPHLPALTAEDAATLARLVSGGAHLVLLGDVLPQQRALVIPTMSPMPAATSASVRGSFTAAFVLSHAASRVHVLARAAGRPVAVAVSLGKGAVVAIASAQVFSNAALAHAQNARFAFDVLSARSPLLFDESVHGYTTNASMWAVLPQTARDAVWIAVATLLLAVFGALFRSAPPIALAPPRLRDSSAYLASMARLLRRARAGRAAIERFSRDAALLARARPSAAKRLAIAAELSHLEVLSELTHPSDDALIDAARTLTHLRKELA